MPSGKLKQQVRIGIDATIAKRLDPIAPRNGIGLALQNCRRFRRLMDARGRTPAGTYYFQKTGKEAPKHFYHPYAFRKGRRMRIMTLDGSTRAVATWNNIHNAWKPTQLGKRLYKNANDKYTVLLPVSIDLT